MAIGGRGHPQGCVNMNLYQLEEGQKVLSAWGGYSANTQ
jgi:hypothetical protein